MNRGRKFVAVLASATMVLAAWLWLNPPGRFGWSCFGYTTYGALPRPISDFQVRADGTTRKVAKRHELSFEQIEWLLSPKPEVLFIAQGWHGVTTPDAAVHGYEGCRVEILKNKEAIKFFNRLIRSGKRVAIHYHSTC